MCIFNKIIKNILDKTNPWFFAQSILRPVSNNMVRKKIYGNPAPVIANLCSINAYYNTTKLIVKYEANIMPSGCSHTCPVCFQKFDESVKAKLLRPCSHVICDGCYTAINKATCPVCKSNVKYKHPIYFVGCEYDEETTIEKMLLIWGGYVKPFIRRFFFTNYVHEIGAIALRYFFIAVSLCLFKFSHVCYIKEAYVFSLILSLLMIISINLIFLVKTPPMPMQHNSYE